MKSASILSVAILGALFALASAYAYGWICEMEYTELRRSSIDRANDALRRHAENPGGHIIRPPAEDASFYK